MRESPLGFVYSWEDLQPIRALILVTGAGQLIGALIGLAYAPLSDVLLRLWFGGSVASLPAFIVGLWVQARWRQGSIRQNIVMVRWLGVMAVLLSLTAWLMPQLGWG